MLKRILLLCSMVSVVFMSEAQTNDTTSNVLDELVVTATRSEKKFGNVAVPVIIINKKTIRQSGSLRLDKILQEQTGLFISNSFGSGVQIQGLSTDYVLILIDGQPLVGRNGGVLDLSRITVNNIEKIEIVEGPSSSLYGSEAMGGVINIITDKSITNNLNASLRYGSFNTSDANIGGSLQLDKFSVFAFANRNGSDGYDFYKNDTGQTVQPYYSYTTQVKLQQQFNNNVKAGVLFRYYYEHQSSLYSAENDVVSGNPSIKEYNINPFVNIRFNNRIRTSFNGYATQYESADKEYLQHNDSLYYEDFFQQRFVRIENQTDINISKENLLTVGGGYTHERLNTNRYSGIRTNSIGYLFAQDEQRIADKLTVIAGLRYDNNEAYQSRLSPKLAIQYHPVNKLRINASYGAGFKAPDYRQLYLNFTNNAAGGYTVYGANEITTEELHRQLGQGSIISITPFGEELQLLKPEYSKGLNIGASYEFSKSFFSKINFFRNDINNLITTEVIAYKSNNAPIYSYFNVNSVLTRGAELQLNYRFNKNLQAEAGYQYLITADKEVLDEIKEGKMFGKQEGSLESVKLTRSDYGGLNGRSKNMANLKLFYDNEKWFATLRGIYRSRWGVTDKDGNLILNRDDEYADGYVLLNTSAGYNCKNGFKLMAGIDNLLNYRDKAWLQQQPGISFYGTVQYSINYKNKK
ncbi:MAG TPA: TonB-dependent receptor [Parafilimonas sp.]|nr:TonB-dependent receptor [Parafilimonas sp.]